MFTAVEDVVTATTSAQHLQRVHGADRADAVCCSLLDARLSQDSVRTPVSTEVNDPPAEITCLVLRLPVFV